jgi:Ca2+-binding RTX toxin-like protein
MAGSAVGTALMVLALGGSAQAAQIAGTAGDDRIRGTVRADVIDGSTGNDSISARRGADTVTGGEGNDLLRGGFGADRQFGGPGNDTIYAGRGRDETWGEDGDDSLWALARADVHGRADTRGDVLHGSSGNDTFRTRDGEADTIDCGPGVDTVYADFKDVLANPAECEVVNRARRVKQADDQRENADPAQDATARD